MNEFENLYMKLHTESALKREKITVTKLLHKFIVEAMQLEPEKYRDVLADKHLISPYSNHMNRLITVFVVMNTPPHILGKALDNFSPKRYAEILLSQKPQKPPIGQSGNFS